MQFNKDAMLQMAKELCVELGIEWDDDADNFTLAEEELTLSQMTSRLYNGVIATGAISIEQNQSENCDILVVNNQSIDSLNTYQNILFIAA